MPFSVILSVSFSIVVPSCGGRGVTGQLNHVHDATIQHFADSCQCVHADVFSPVPSVFQFMLCPSGMACVSSSENFNSPVLNLLRYFSRQHSNSLLIMCGICCGRMIAHQRIHAKRRGDGSLQKNTVIGAYAPNPWGKEAHMHLTNISPDDILIA